MKKETVKTEKPVTMVEAIRQGIWEEMVHDEPACIVGKDVGAKITFLRS